MYYQNIKKQLSYFSIIFFVLLFFYSCKNESGNKASESEIISKIEVPDGMIWVEGKTFLQGAKESDKYAMPREKPAHMVTVDGFFIDITEVTNVQFKTFVEATNYITIAEREIDWEEMKKELPTNTLKPHDSILQPGSLIFNKSVNAFVNMDNYGQWWTWKTGANWRHPEGPESGIEGKDDYPVVHVAYQDALAYCKWANRRLPTEAEWESAAQGKNSNTIFTWGNDASKLDFNANTWQGVFPINNDSKDGFEFIAPVKSYPPNSIGLFDMAGNVWEITNDFFNVNYYSELGMSKPIINPEGAEEHYNPNNPYQIEYVMKGGSFLCNASYCASFRISAKMGVSIDSGSDHMGFRTVATPAMLSG
ncbi:formylglycine-generating enzyme family protein [uncultured Winogradskyella sp.]|mgnify:CR=1 FL=1|uniref:formylglycine-generating enzyme family protein n=1 Tax=uncultured Winogradskyella sp. TaxID=395353 RepID=UPI0026370D23|nr:formylglycine-generating enzyme family protein [uncultured Winogradskyella sp.]|tara:strand:+ start:235 stop:1326 length:1092 start_codon:yes stop_codon:yes gene_type:complete